MTLSCDRKCLECEEEEHIACHCLHRKKAKHSNKKTEHGDEKDDPKGKKLCPSVGLMLDVISEKQPGEEAKLMRVWDKVCDKMALFFFDSRSKANFISPDFASRLGIHVEVMGPMTCLVNCRLSAHKIMVLIMCQAIVHLTSHLID